MRRRRLLKLPTPWQGAVDKNDAEITARKLSESSLRQQLAEIGMPLSRTHHLHEAQLMELLGDNVGLEAMIHNNADLVYSARTG